jgi:hypothetical protein
MTSVMPQVAQNECGLYGMRKNSIGDTVLKGHDFSRADKTNQIKFGFSR